VIVFWYEDRMSLHRASESHMFTVLSKSLYQTDALALSPTTVLSTLVTMLSVFKFFYSLNPKHLTILDLISAMSGHSQPRQHIAS